MVTGGIVTFQYITERLDELFKLVKDLDNRVKKLEETPKVEKPKVEQVKKTKVVEK